MKWPKRIKALVDKPNSGYIKKDEIGIHIHDNIYDFPSQKNYNVSSYYIGSKYEDLDGSPSQPKYKFKEGDGVTHLTATVEEREKIYALLMRNGYPSYSKYENNSTRYGGSWANQFTNNFRFNKHGKWVTSSRQQVTNPMTYEEFKNLIEGNKEFHYEIY
jgi:hypothetical protein